MSNKLLHTKGEKRGEIYLMGNRDPWLLWRLKVMDSGYVPPLLHGRIPPDLARTTLGSMKENYESVVLMEHARRFQTKQRSVVRRMFMLSLTVFILIASLGFLYAINTGSSFKIGFLDTIQQQRTR